MSGHPRLRALVVGLAVALGDGPSARACTCRGTGPARVMVPAEGSRDFPVNGTIRVFLTGFAPDLRARLGEEYRLRDERGALVPVDVQMESTMLTLTPLSPLRPRTSYTVERVFAYTDRDGLLSDADRWHLAEVGPSEEDRARPDPRTAVRRRWYPDGDFVTGPGPEDRRPDAPVAREARVEISKGNGDCGPGTDAGVFYRTGPEVAATDVWALERRGQGPLWYFPPLLQPPQSDGIRLVYVGNTMCTRDRMRIEVEDSYEFRLVAISAGGARAAGAWVSATVEGTPFAEAADGRRNLELRDEGQDPAVRRWFGPPVTEARRARPRTRKTSNPGRAGR